MFRNKYNVEYTATRSFLLEFKNRTFTTEFALKMRFKKRLSHGTECSTFIHLCSKKHFENEC